MLHIQERTNHYEPLTINTFRSCHIQCDATLSTSRLAFQLWWTIIKTAIDALSVTWPAHVSGGMAWWVQPLYPIRDTHQTYPLFYVPVPVLRSTAGAAYLSTPLQFISLYYHLLCSLVSSLLHCSCYQTLLSDASLPHASAKRAPTDGVGSRYLGRSSRFGR